MLLTSREAASLTLLLIFIVFAIVKSKDRRQLKNSWGDVVKQTLRPKVLQVILVYGATIAALTYQAAWIGLWDVMLLKDTLVLAIFSGIPLLIFKSLEADDGKQLLLSITKETFGVTALAITYVNLTSLPYVLELLLQTLVVILIFGVNFNKRDPSQASTVALFNRLLGFIGISLFVWVSNWLIQRHDTYDWGQQLRSFAFSVYLPITMIPFAYMLGIIASAETKLVLLQIHNKQVKKSTKLAMIIGFHGSLRYVRAFCGQWLIDVANAKSYHEARDVMCRYRQVVRAHAQMNRKRKRRLQKLAGSQGRDDNGRWIDRREFYETKQTLESVYFAEMGLYRNHGHRYQGDKNVVLPIAGFDYLSEPRKIHLDVRSDAQAWYAWRQTVGGCCLAVGGSSDVDTHWRYSSEMIPDSFPGEGGSEWVDQNRGSGSEDWAFDDSPTPRC